MEFSPTPYSVVNALLQDLLRGVQGILGETLVGMYLYGSLASGDFNPRTSDIDFVSVTEGELPESLVSSLAALHYRLWAGGSAWAAKLEGCYVPLRVIRRHDPLAPPCPGVNEGRFYLAGLGADWIFQRRILRDQGVVLAGPHPRIFIAPVSDAELRAAVVQNLREWWRPMLDDPLRLRRADYRAYAVLSMCRSLYTLRHAAIASKPVAARWARAELGERWSQLIDEALAWPDGPQADRTADTLALIRFAIRYAGTS